MIARIALRNVLRHRLRSTFVVMGLAIAVALLADMLMLSSGMERTFYRVLESVGFEIRICPPGTLPFTTEAVIPQSRKVANTAAAQAGVARVVRVLANTLYAGRSGGAPGTLPVTVMGVDAGGQPLYRVVEGEDIDTHSPHTGSGVPVVIDRNAAAALGVGIGDGIVLRREPAGAAVPFEEPARAVVVGIARVEFDLRQQRTLVAPLSFVQGTVTGPPDPASFLLVKLAPPPGAAPAAGFVPANVQKSVAAGLRAALPDLSVYSIDDVFAELTRTLAYFQQFARILSTISVVIAFLLIGVVLTIGVNERRGEIAALRSMGFRPRTIATMVFAESATLVTIAAAAGAALGWVLAGYLDGILTQSPSLPAGYSFFVPEPSEIAGAVGITALVGIVAALYPALAATRIDIPQTLHEEAT